MSGRDTEILFDFPDDDWSGETRQLQPGGGRRRPPERVPARLAALVAAVVLVSVVIAISTQGCGAPSTTGQARSYFQKLAVIGSHSQQLGQQFSKLITKTATKSSTFASSLDQLSQRAQQDLLNAQKLAPPVAFRPEQVFAVQALQFRVTGLQALAATLRLPALGVRQAGTLLAAVERLLASDVVWHDRVEGDAQAQLRRARVTGIAVPGSRFLTSADIASTQTMTQLLQRLSGHPPPGKTQPTLKLGDRGSAVASWQKLLVNWLRLRHQRNHARSQTALSAQPPTRSRARSRPHKDSAVTASSAARPAKQ
jgi:hypothetical protein